jgi:hypothetical protein
MQRYQDWAARLEVFLQEQKGRRFQYGSWDCCLFVCEAISAMTGSDLGVEFRGKYDSLRSAEALIRRYCPVQSLSALVAGVATRWGMREVSPLHARRGDMAMIRRGRGYSLGMIALDGQRVLVLVGRDRVAAIPRLVIARAWSVG